MSNRRSRGYLAFDINNLLKGVVTGEIETAQGVKLTAANIAKLLVEVDGLDKEDRPSSGAVTALLQKWEEMGYVRLGHSPLHFAEFTEAASTIGYDELERLWTERRRDVPDEVKYVRKKMLQEQRAERAAKRQAMRDDELARAAVTSARLDQLAGDDRPPAPSLPF